MGTATVIRAIRAAANTSSPPLDAGPFTATNRKVHSESGTTGSLSRRSLLSTQTIASLLPCAISTSHARPFKITDGHL